MNTLGLALKLWAKSNPKTGDWHPLACHMLDVAAVTRSLASGSRCSAIVDLISRKIQLRTSDAISWISFLAALHDLGKANPCFQFLRNACPEVQRELRVNGFGIKEILSNKRIPHGQVTAITLVDSVKGISPKPDDCTLCRFARVLAGHHGVFFTSDNVNKARRQLHIAEQYKDLSSDTWCELRQRITGLLAEILLPQIASVPLLEASDNSTPMLLAGLISIADWIGSSEEHFPYRKDCADPRAYWSLAQQRAKDALSNLGWIGACQPEKAIPFSSMFPFIEQPRPLQKVVIDFAGQKDLPRLVLIESPMGEGKTEAALYLQDHWSLNRGQIGAYLALPTMAASNQLYSRSLEFIAQRFPAEKTNVLLLHSHRQLNADFEDLRTSAINQDDSAELGGPIVDEWFTKPKRGLLAPFAVGTVDQSLLSVLQVRHGFVRLFGLAGKTLIFDEVHAYDTYMLTLFERLLEWLSEINTTVVILSATLPLNIRRKMLQAYSGNDQVGFEDKPYPRITRFSDDGMVRVEHIPVSSDRSSEIVLQWIDDNIQSAWDLIKMKLINGGCTVWICNTVNRAQNVYAELRNRLVGPEIELELFHARFPLGQRIEIEERILKRYGKDSSQRPHKAILIATQVVEQSLDLDFDLMLTEIAPVDLLLQRSGRMHRHKTRQRPAGLELPHLIVFKPEGHDEEFPNLRRSVYSEYILLRSWITLRHKRCITIPGDVEQLIEAVYGDTDFPIPDRLAQKIKAAREELEEDQKRANFEGRKYEIKPPDGEDILEHWSAQLDEDDPDQHISLQARTRLSPPSVTIVCLHSQEEVQVPRAEPLRTEKIRHLIESSVSLSYRGCTQHLPNSMVPSEWSRIGLLRNCRAVIFQNGAPEQEDIPIRLDKELGIVRKRKGEEDDNIIQSDL